MKPQISFKVVDHDEDYLGLEIFASNERYSGTTRVYASNKEFTQFCSVLDGFPEEYQDTREYIFGNPDVGYAGGYCKLSFYCDSGTGRSTLTVEILDDELHGCNASAIFRLVVLPAELDNFLLRLKRLESNRTGCSQLYQ